MHDIRYVKSFVKIRAIWAILRNGSVIWNAELRGTDGHLDTRASKEAPGIVVVHNLLVNGRPVELSDIRYATTEPVSDGSSVEADRDIGTS